MDRSTDELIRELARDLAPVRRSPSLELGLAAALLTWGGTIAVFALSTGPWSNALKAVRAQPESALVLVGLAMLGTGGLLQGLAAALPGREAASRAGLVFAGVGSALIGVTALYGHFAPATDLYVSRRLQWDSVCIGLAALLALPTALLGIQLCRRGAGIRMQQSALALAFGTTALGATMVQAICGEASVRHTMASHVLAPLLVAPAVGLLICATRLVQGSKSS